MSHLVLPEWTAVYTGLPQGIQLQPTHGGGAGRLITCANHITAEGGHSHTIFSDDGGATWENGGLPGVEPTHMGECSLAQAADGAVYM